MHREKPSYSHCDLPSYPQCSLPLADPHLPPAPPSQLLPPHPAPPPPKSLRRPLIWSDTTTYPRQRSSPRRLSYPRVPAVRSPLSPPVLMVQSPSRQGHMGAPLQRPPNPQWSRRNSQHAQPVCFSRSVRGGRDAVSTSGGG
ncbi:hypothetical protein VZT92_017976 [Zoarces viviparus]|uniref:Uncharacterized protein n=1 Tax=Zoarces viviparus TaxID=48416 RepID=A0AAW1EQ03_ZOAVI